MLPFSSTLINIQPLENTTQTSHFKGPLSCLRQFLTTKRPLKMIKNAFYFILKSLFVLMQKKRLDKKTQINFKIYDVTD